jgi:glycosyltransferase involved in cell wall biosynthesis
MKILIPIVEFGRAGGYRVLSNLANEWIKSGHDVHFICPIASSAPYFPTIARISYVDKFGATCTQADLIPVKSYNFIQRWRGLIKGMNYLPEAYDIILANHSLTAYPITFSKIRGKKFYYIQAYEPQYGLLNGGLSHKILAVLAWNSYNLNFERIVNANIYKNYKNIRSKTVVLPGLDLSTFYNKERMFSNAVVKIGCIGRIETYKGTKYVLEAFKNLRETGASVGLYVAFGDKNLENVEQELHIVFPKNDFELAEFYRQMDIIIAPGTVQLGAVHYPVIESMACGTSIITTAYYPANDNNAWIVPIKNAQAIEQQILNVINDPDLRNKRILNGLEAVKQFEWTKVATEMLSSFLQK